jgi:hypothetical protein
MRNASHGGGEARASQQTDWYKCESRKRTIFVICAHTVTPEQARTIQNLDTSALQKVP